MWAALRAASTMTACGVPGLRTDNDGLANSRALQRAIDRHNSVSVSCAGTYDVAATLFVRSNTHLSFATGVHLRKVRAKQQPALGHVVLNRGALTRTADENITVDGLSIVVNGMEGRAADMPVPGLRGQAAFFHVTNLRVRRFRCLDLLAFQFGLHVCSFRRLLVEDVEVAGKKDGVHLGRGEGFVLRRATFQTFDDAVALNAADYVTSTPELGWISHGVVEDVEERAQPAGAPHPVGAFSRLLAGAWLDWRAGMQLQHSDTVVHSGGLYRVLGTPDGRSYRSTVPPASLGGEVLGRAVAGGDGVPWLLVQRGALYDAGVRNVTFRNVSIRSRRAGVWLKFDQNRFYRSAYPGATLPVQGPVALRDVTHALVGYRRALVRAETPHVGLTVRGAACLGRGCRVGSLCRFCKASHDTAGSGKVVLGMHGGKVVGKRGGKAVGKRRGKAAAADAGSEGHWQSSADTHVRFSRLLALRGELESLVKRLANMN